MHTICTQRVRVAIDFAIESETRHTHFLYCFVLIQTAALMEHVNDDSDDECNIQCDSYAETCRLELINQNCTNGSPAQKQYVIAQKPRFESKLITITDGHNATR